MLLKEIITVLFFFKLKKKIAKALKNNVINKYVVKTLETILSGIKTKRKLLAEIA